MAESAVLFHSYSFAAPPSRNESHQVSFIVSMIPGKIRWFLGDFECKVSNFRV